MDGSQSPPALGKPSYQCSQCPKTFSRLEYVRRHERKHQDLKPFPCPECTKSFARSDVLLRHRRRCHPSSFDGSGALINPPASATAPAAPAVATTSTNTKAARKAVAAPYSIPSSSLFLPPSPPPTAPSPNTAAARTSGLNSAPSGDGLAPYAILNPSGGYVVSNAWAKQTPAQNDKTGSETRQMRPDLSYANFQMDPSLAQAGFGIAGGRLGAWNPADPSPPTTISTDSPETSTSSGTSNLEPSPGPVGQDNTSFLSSGSNDLGGQHGGNGFAPLPSPSSFLPPFSPSAFFSSNNSFPFPAPSPLSNNQLPPFSPGQFLSQFNFGESPAPGQSTFPVSPGAENHPEAGFLFDGLLSPNSLNSILALPSPSTLGFSTTTTSSDEESNGRASLRNMEEEELRLIEGGAWLVPEKRMLSSEGGLRGQRGRFDEYTVSPMDPFYIDPQKFGGCYAVEHWQLPPIQTLTKVARRTVTQVIPHLPFLHIPSFSLNKVPGCVGFAISSCGRPLRGRKDMLGEARENDGDEDGGPGSWDGLKSVVKTEKTDMLVRSFTRSKGVLFTEYNLGLLQALLLYNAPAFLSDSQEQRMGAHMHLGTIINIARQIGVFDAENDHVKGAPTFDWQEKSLESEWQKWIKAEGARRTAWIIYVLDTVASLETGCPRLISASEMADFPLPAADPVWCAPDAVSWINAVSALEASDKTLATALGYLFVRPGEKETECLMNAKWQSGPFFWLCCILTMTREVVELGEGKRRAMAGDGVRWAWWAKDEDMPQLISEALERWRRGWDFDALCTPLLPTTLGCLPPGAAIVDGSDSASPESFSSGANSSPGDGSASNGTSGGLQDLPYAEVYFCREALPYFWFSKMLLGMLTQANPLGVPQTDGNFKPGVNQFRAKGVDYRAVLESARIFSRAGEGLR